MIDIHCGHFQRNGPSLEEVIEPLKPAKTSSARIPEIFTNAHNLNHPILGMLADLLTIEEVRIIEGKQ
jgi:hypothetical protein